MFMTLYGDEQNINKVGDCGCSGKKYRYLEKI